MPLIERQDMDGCAVLVFSRPAVLNALNTALLDCLDDHLDRIEDDRSRAFILAGNGRAFSVGSDLKESGGDPDRRIARMHRLMIRMRDFPKISVAAVGGYALGGGLEMALGCTFRIADTAAIFGLPEIGLSVMPCYGATQLLPRLIGETRALDMMLSGEPIDADTALHWGLVDRVSPAGEALKAAVAFACARSGKAPLAERAIRQAASMIVLPLGEGLSHEHRLALEVSASPQAEAGLAAFRAR